MSNSSLVSYTKISPNKTVNRNHKIDTITPHCVVGQLSVETIGSVFTSSSAQASSNYGIGSDGRIGMYVEEKDRSWCSSNAANDHRAVTIECASDTKDPYAINDKVFKSLINLCVDICKRNGKNKLIWFGDKAKTLAYTPKSNEMLITVHRWFANKACPGDYIYNRLGQIAAEVTKILNQEKDDDDMVIYKTFSDIPSWAKTTVKKLMEKGYLEGTGAGLNLEENMLRVLVINDRAGLYDLK